MTREEKCKLAIEKGFTYNQETGHVFGVLGKEIKSKDIKGYIMLSLTKDKKHYTLKGHQFAWYWVNKECVTCLDHINRITNDNRICNLRSVTNKENLLNSDFKNINIKNGIIRREKTKNEIYSIIEEWNFELYNKINQQKVATLLDKSIITIKRNWSDVKDLVKSMNQDYNNNIKCY